MVLRYIFRTIGVLISLYSMLCLFRIIITWIPQLSYSKIASFLASVCDSYLNRFRNIKFLKLGGFDFSPALALCLLGAAASLCSSISNGGAITPAFIFCVILQVIWSIANSILTLLIILFAIRLIIIYAKKDSYSGSYIFDQIDNSISPLVYKLSKTFSFGKTLSYKTSLIVSICTLIFFSVLGSFIFMGLEKLIFKLM